MIYLSLVLYSVFQCLFPLFYCFRTKSPNALSVSPRISPPYSTLFLRFPGAPKRALFFFGIVHKNGFFFKHRSDARMLENGTAPHMMHASY